MATLDSDNPPIFQRFESQDGKPLASLPTHVCPETRKRYILWDDIQSTFADVVFLRCRDNSDHLWNTILFMINQDGDLRQPLCIEILLSHAYTVVCGDPQVPLTEPSLQDQHEHNALSAIKSTIDSGQKLLTPLAHHFGAAKGIHSRLARSDGRDIFQQRVANARYYSVMLIRGIEAREGTGIKVLVDEMDRGQILDSLGKWEQNVTRLDYENICWNMLDRPENVNTAASTIFIVLPSSLDSWIDTDSSTHQFRLYFLCEHLTYYNGSKLPQHYHLSNHPGYNLNQPQEFFQRYGDYALKVLQMTERGYLNYPINIPSLDTLEILWGCNPNITGNHLSKDTIGALIDKAIGYLQDLSPPKWGTRLRLTYSQSAAIKSYLDVQDGDNAEGNLNRQINSKRYVSWVCQAHNDRPVKPERLDDLKEFADSHGGHVDMRQAVIQVELGSIAEMVTFRDLLKNISGFDISIKLTWKATPEELTKGFSDFPKMEALVLEIDGFATDIHSHQFIMDLIHRSLKDDTDFGIVTFLNYPRPQEYCIYIGDFGLRLKSPPKRPFHNWEEVRSNLIVFGEIVSTTRLSSECVAASRELQSALKDNELSEVTAISMSDEGWIGEFDLKAGAFIEVMSYDMTLPEIVTSTESVRKLILLFAVTESYQDLYYFVQAANGIQELYISTEGRDVLSHVDFIERLRRPWEYPLQITLFDVTDDVRDRNVAQITIRAERRHLEGRSNLEIRDIDDPSTGGQEEAQEPSMVLEFTHWDRDYSLSPLSDYHASFLDIASLQHPSVLTSFVLEISSRSANCLTSIQNIVCQSRLEHLVVVTTLLDPVVAESIVKILRNISWSTLKSLVLMGDSIDEWIQIWPRPISPSLLCLQIAGPGSMIQELSHSSVMFLRELIGMSTLVELHFENIQLQDRRDWRLIVESMDPSLLECFCMCAHSSSQLLATVVVVDLFLSMFKSSSQDGTNQMTVHRMAFDLDITHLSYLGLIHAENVLRRTYSLERLSIVCSNLDTDLSAIVARVLELIPWTTLKSLALSGDNINEWIRLYPTVVTPQLLSLEVRGVGSTPLELSHSSILVIQNQIDNSPMETLTFENIILQDKDNWIPIMESVNPISLSDFKLCEHGKADLLASADAANLYKSKFPPEEEVAEDSDSDFTDSD